MITNIAIIFVTFAIELINWFPFTHFSIPYDWTETVNVILGYALRFEGVVPIKSMLVVLGTILFFEFALWMVKIILMIVNFVRGTGSINI